MSKARLEAFSDGVLAILITILVLELKIPAGSDLQSLAPVAPVFLTYMLSFIYLGIYWNNHHHMFHVTSKISGGVMWANLNLLFWLSLIPFSTGWMGENHFREMPAALYGSVLLMSALAYLLLQTTIIRAEGAESKLGRAVGNDWKGKISLIFYFVGILLAFRHPVLSQSLYVAVALIWLIPDRRIERIVGKK